MKWWKKMAKGLLFAAFYCLIGISLCAGGALAAPSVKISDRKDNVIIQEAVTDEILAEIKKSVGDKKDLAFTLQKAGSIEDLTKLCEAFPGMVKLSIDGPKELTSIAPVAKLKSLKHFSLRGGTVADFSPLSDLTGLDNLQVDGNNVKNGMMAPDLKWMSKLTNLTRLDIGAPSALRTLVSFEGIPAAAKLTSTRFSGGAPADLTPLQALSSLKKLDLVGSKIADLTPLTGLPKLEELSLYGVEVKDFSPLAGCPKLKFVMYYATKDADYSTLGKLAQVQELKGGLTDLADISWVVNLPNLRKFDVFAEKVTDYTPLAKTKVEDFQIWKMKNPADLKMLSGVASLKKLKLWNQKIAGGFEGLGSLVNLEELILHQMSAKDGTPVDMAFAKSLVNLKKLEINDSEISHFDAVAACAKLESVSIAKATGITSLAALKKLPNLKAVTVSKGMFPDAELAGFAATVKVNQR